FSRYELGSLLPRRYQCVPTDDQARQCRLGFPARRCIGPLFNSRLFGRPGYGQLASGTSAETLAASENGSEVGAFANRLNTIRLNNLQVKLREFMPVGLSAVIVAET